MSLVQPCLLVLLGAVALAYALVQARWRRGLAASLMGLLPFLLANLWLLESAPGWRNEASFLILQILLGLLGAGILMTTSSRSPLNGTDSVLASDQIRSRASQLWLENSPQAILVQDLYWHTVYHNPGAARLYGWPPNSINQREITAALFEQDANTVAQAREAVLSEGKWSGQLRLRTADGRELVVDSQWLRLTDAQGAPEYILMANTLVNTASQTGLALPAAERMESLGALAGGMAHDLNNILSPILMAIQLLQAEETNPGRKKLLNSISLSAERGADIARQVLAYARGQAGEHGPVQLKHIIREWVKVALETFPSTIKVKTALASKLPAIQGNATQLHQVLLNLCLNARDAMPSGGVLRIEAETVTLDEEAARRIAGAQPGAYVVLRVSDTGTGIPPEVRERMFEPFFTTKAAHQGTGLGLATVAGILKNHKALLDITTAVGQGTTFSIYFTPTAESVPTGAEERLTEALRGAGQLILVVDDEKPVRDLVETVLVKNNYRVLLAENGSQGLELFREHAPELGGVLIDTKMPVLDGASALRQMRQVRPDLPYVLISGLMERNPSAVAACGSNLAVLRKPFTSSSLLEALKQVV